MRSPHPLPYNEILKVMPTDKSIAKIYKEMTERETLEDMIPTWGDAGVIYIIMIYLLQKN